MRQFVQSRPTVRTLVRGLALTAVVAVAACASTPPPPPPPPPPGGSGAVLMDWRGVISVATPPGPWPCNRRVASVDPAI